MKIKKRMSKKELNNIVYNFLNIQNERTSIRHLKNKLIFFFLSHFCLSYIFFFCLFVYLTKHDFGRNFKNKNQEEKQPLCFIDKLKKKKFFFLNTG